MKRLVITSFLVLISISGFSQEKKLTQKKKTTFGITAGLNSNFHTLHGYRNQEPTNLYGGIFVERSLKGRFRLQAEILYSRIQSENYNMFELPVSLKYEISDRFRVLTGFQVNYLYNRRDLNFFDRKIENPINFGVHIGAEYDLSEKWFLSLRYTHRFTKSVHPDINNIKGFRLGIGFRF